jgi:S-methylmethionine-dependent homocysteine/selenocysteine methylase
MFVEMFYPLSFPDAHKVLIAGSVGPYGSALHDGSEYTGSYMAHASPKEMADWHRPRIQALVEAGVDILAFETIPAQSEGEVLVELLKEFPEQKAWLSFSCKVCTICYKKSVTTVLDSALQLQKLGKCQELFLADILYTFAKLSSEQY